MMSFLYINKVQSLIVEGGAITHQSFLDAGLWDEIRIETATSKFVKSGTEAPRLPHDVKPISHAEYDDNVIDIYERS